MTITIFGTDWCDDTRRTRAFLTGKGLKSKYIDIEARPDEAERFLSGGAPVKIPMVEFPSGMMLAEPTIADLEQALADQALVVAVRHRTKLHQALRRFEQYRDDQLVASAEFVDRDGTIVIVNFQHHEPVDASLKDESLERLTAGLVKIVQRSKREVDIDLGSEPFPPSPLPSDRASAPVTSVPPPPDPSRAAPAVEACPLTQQFTRLWSDGTDHRGAVEFARREGVGRLAVVKGLHALWEMPLTPEAMALAFDESGEEDLAAMFHVLGWIIEQNPVSTMSEFQAFDDATGVSVKTHALSSAKRPRDAISLVDRMTPGLVLRAIDEAQAREVAALAIRESDGLLRIQDQSTLRHSFGWMFLYQSVEYLDTGDYSTMVSGNAPLLVDRFTGALWPTGTAERPDVYAQNYIATGNPMIPAPASNV